MKKIYIILIVVAIALILSVYLLKRFNIIKSMSILDKRFRYFNIDEFDSPAQATDTGEKYNKNGRQYLRNSGADNIDLNMVKMLDNARHLIEKEWNENNPTKEIVFRINSGYRTQGYNDSLPQSVPNSSHITGKASDISLSGYDNEQMEVVVNALRRVGFSRFGFGRTYVHVDNDASKTQNTAWDYGSGSISIDPFAV